MKTIWSSKHGSPGKKMSMEAETDVMTKPDPEVPLLRQLVQEHKVCWESFPKLATVRSRLRRIGFDLELYETHYQPQQPPTPGCRECQAVYEDLRLIARWIIPLTETESRYPVEPFDVSIRFSRKRKFRDDVTLTVSIIDMNEVDREVAPCQSSCLEAMERNLKKLGARGALVTEKERHA